MRKFEELVKINEAIENPVMDFFNDLKLFEEVYNKVKQIILQHGLEFVPTQNRIIYMNKDNGANYGGITISMGISNPGGTTVAGAMVNPQTRMILEKEIRDNINSDKIVIHVEAHFVLIRLIIETI